MRLRRIGGRWSASESRLTTGHFCIVSTSQTHNAEQIPTYDPIHMAGHESLGDFIFVPQTL